MSYEGVTADSPPKGCISRDKLKFSDLSQFLTMISIVKFTNKNVYMYVEIKTKELYEGKFVFFTAANIKRFPQR